MPHLIAEPSDEERARSVRIDTGAMILADGVGNFLKARLPIQLEDGRSRLSFERSPSNFVSATGAARPPVEPFGVCGRAAWHGEPRGRPQPRPPR